ncbi:hypothetical protein FOXYS1_16192 [Fusarium oxysporum]|uniref:Uncharacterized protein n=1 Tax=Fusarium oxysporum TaxID=5507 RepID=A0A8H4YF35_FUSOX|nr:hypothetical protein FOXYS1_16192 [Fusarium oxysporum]
MPPPSAAQQKVLIAQFVALTGQSERQATRVRIFRVHLPYVDHREPSWSLTRYLKNAGFKLNEAVDT